VKESGKLGSTDEMKTPVKRCQFLDKQREKNGPARKRFTILKFTECCIEK
jgi:hypothetical protein